MEQLPEIKELLKRLKPELIRRYHVRSPMSKRDPKLLIEDILESATKFGVGNQREFSSANFETTTVT